MKKYSYLILSVIFAGLMLNIFAISGCSKENKVILVEMGYIKNNMKKVTEISMWDCNGVDDKGHPEGMIMRKKISDQNNISNIMSAIKKVDAGPSFWPSYLNLICFKDSEGRIYCTSIDFVPADKFVYGWGFVDWDYRLYDVLDAAGLAPKEPNSAE
jgi:hypothetical protein